MNRPMLRLSQLARNVEHIFAALAETVGPLASIGPRRLPRIGRRPSTPSAPRRLFCLVKPFLHLAQLALSGLAHCHRFQPAHRPPFPTFPDRPHAVLLDGENLNNLAEERGFEPLEALRLRRFSKPSLDGMWCLIFKEFRVIRSFTGATRGQPVSHLY